MGPRTFTTVLLAAWAAVVAPAFGAFPGGNGRVAYSNSDGSSETSDLFGVRPDGRGARLLVDGADFDASPAYSADGRQVAWISLSDTGLRELRVAGADGATQRVVAQVPGIDVLYRGVA